MDYVISYPTATSKEDFKGWEIIYIEYWKENVRKVWIRKPIDRGYSFAAMFANNDLASQLKEGEVIS